MTNAALCMNFAMACKAAAEASMRRGRDEGASDTGTATGAQAIPAPSACFTSGIRLRRQSSRLLRSSSSAMVLPACASPTSSCSGSVPPPSLYVRCHVIDEHGKSHRPRGKDRDQQARPALLRASAPECKPVRHADLANTLRRSRCRPRIAARLHALRPADDEEIGRAIRRSRA